MSPNTLANPNGNAHPRSGASFKLMLLAVLVLLVMGAWWLLRGKSSEPAENKKPKTFKTSVTAATALVQDVTLSLSGLGSVVPLNTISVKSRVDGQLMELHYQEGQLIHKGGLLAVIDERPFKAQLEQFQGQLARDQAQLINARLDRTRYQELIKTGAVAAQQLDTQAALVRQLEGSVKSGQGQVDSAKLQLAYCRITAPLTGRVGLRPVDPGNMIQASNQVLAVITQVEPISVIFTIPEDHLPKVLDTVRSGGRLAVDAYDREQKVKLAQGELLSIDNQIDQTTGTVRLRAQFDNKDGKLFPNQFVNAKIAVSTIKDAVTIPSAAIQRGPGNSTLVYVVQEEATVEARTVEPGENVGGMTVIRHGLAAGETIVIDGADKLRDGAPVSVKDTGGPAQNGEGANRGKAATDPDSKPGGDGNTSHQKKGASARRNGS